MRLVKGYASRLLIDAKGKKVWRYGWGRAGESIKHNYTWLQKACAVIPTPKPLSFHQFGPLIITSETFIAGRPLTPQEASGEYFKLIMATIAPLYQKTKLIHGDLTHRNILLDAHSKIYFIDGDGGPAYAGQASPEFDRWLLQADARAHLGGHTSHRKFIQQLLNSPLSDSPLWPKFIARCLAHSVRDCVRRGKSLDWLDELG